MYEASQATLLKNISQSVPLGPPKPEDYVPKSHDSLPRINSYQIKPTLIDRFKENPVKEIIRGALKSFLQGKKYEAEAVKRWTISIANDINDKLRELEMKRYRHIVQIVIGEMKGAGVKSAFRAIWDSETDGYASETFINDTLFCVATVFGIYVY